MDKNVGYIAVVVAVLVLAATVAPAASTQELAHCIQDSVQVNGQRVLLQSEACEPLEQVASICIESELQRDGTELLLRSSGCHTNPQPQPTDAPEPTPAVGEPYPQAPACPDHDSRAYHSLWDAERGCHYDHTHGDNPHSVDHLFGSDYYRWAGGEISYPWQTPQENVYKHGAYTWLVRRNLPCESQFADGCITDFRAQFHGVGAAQGAVVSFHSAWLEARVCPISDPDNCGIVRAGGWQGPVDLFVGEQRVLDRENSENRLFLHFYETGNPNYGTWYTGADTGLFTVVPQFEDMWNTVPPAGTAQQIVANAEWFCADQNGNLVYDGCANNSSIIAPHVIAFQLPARDASTVDADGDGIANYWGYVDRYGQIDASCHEPGAHCIPFQLQNVSLSIGYQYRGSAREYDICFAADGSLSDCPGATSSGWIEFPLQMRH